MKLKKIQIKNWRPYIDIDLDLSKSKRIILIGGNDTGKTELLNAIYWALWGRVSSKAISFSSWKKDLDRGERKAGLFNNYAWYQLKEGSTIPVGVRLVFGLNEDELGTGIPAGDLDITRMFYLRKEQGEEQYLTRSDLQTYPDLSTTPKLKDLIEQRGWDGKLFLKRPTQNSNSQISLEPKDDLSVYFPNENVTRFYLLDSLLLRDFLGKHQGDNKKNIDSISDVKDITKLISNLKEVGKDIKGTKEKLEKKQVKDNAELADLRIAKGKLEKAIDSIQEKKSKDFEKEWDEAYEDRGLGNRPKQKPFYVGLAANSLDIIQRRLKWIEGIESEAEETLDTEEGKQAIADKVKAEDILRAQNRTVGENLFDASDAYFEFASMKSMEGSVSLLVEQMATDEVIPPVVTKEYLTQLLEAESCCCGRPLTKKHDSERNKIEEIISRIIGTDASSQIAQISNRAGDYANDKKNLLNIYSKFLEAMDDIGRNTKEIKATNERIDKHKRTIVRLGGEEAIKKGIAQEGYIKRKRKAYDDYKRDELGLKVLQGGLTKDVDRKKQEIKGIETKLRRVEGSNDELDLLYEEVELCERAIKKLEDLKDDFQKSLKERIKKDFKEEFNAMHWRDDYQVAINDDFEISLQDQRGTTITDAASQGGSQMACLAFNRVLRNFSSFNMPLVLDTPYGNLDLDVRPKVTERLLKTEEESVGQLIMLASTSELATPKDFFDSILPKKNVKSFQVLLIEQKEVEKGVKASGIKEITIKDARNLIEKADKARA